MYTVFLSIQYIGIILLIIEIITIIYQRPSMYQSRLLLVVVGVLVTFFSYLNELQASTESEAINSVRMSYLSKPLVIYLMFIFVMDFCKIAVPMFIRGFLLTFHFFVAILVYTCESHTLYYSSIEFTNEGLYPHLVLGHGAMYIINSAVYFIYFALLIGMCIRRTIKTTNKFERHQLRYLLAIVSTCVFGYVLFLTGVTMGYDTTLPALLIATVLLTICITKYNLLDMVVAAKDYAMDHFDDGLVVVDNDGDFVYSNRQAEIVARGLGADLDENFVDILDTCLENGTNIIFVKKEVYRVSKRPIINGGISCGEMYIILNVTDSYNYAERLQQDVSDKTKEIVDIQHSVIISFATMIEARDGITGLHIKNTINYVDVLVDAMLESDKYKNVLTYEYATLIKDAAALHDIGKISIPDYVLQKPGKLTDEEYDIIKTHPSEGAKILDSTLKSLEKDEYLSIAREMTLYHHERWDGKGYPQGLCQEEIPLPARIMAIADVYDALRSVRHYKDSFSVEKSCQIMRENSGTQFDPDLVTLFLENIERIEMMQVCSAGGNQ